MHSLHTVTKLSNKQYKMYCPVINFRQTLTNVGFDVVAMVATKSSIFWNIMPCSLSKLSQYFWGTHHLHLQGQA
jgi:hypothetical protein